jgi:hypothetical protein
MRWVTTMVLAAAFAVALAGAASAEDPWMTIDEMQAQVVGKGVKGKDAGRNYTEYYLPDGTIEGVWGGEQYDGKWLFYEGQMCFDYEGSAYDECWYLAIEGDQLVYYDKDGNRDPETLDMISK